MSSHWGSTLEKTHFLPNLLSLPCDCVHIGTMLAAPSSIPCPNGFAFQLMFVVIAIPYDVVFDELFH